MKQYDQDVKRIVTYSDPAGAYIRGWLFIVIMVFIVLCGGVMICLSYNSSSSVPLWFALICLFIPFSWYLADNEFTLNALARVTISSQGLRCAFLGRKVKTILWEDIQYCKLLEYNPGKFYKAGSTPDNYVVFSCHELTEQEQKNLLFYAGERNDIIVIKYNEKLLKRIKAEFGEYYRHVQVDVDVLAK